MDTLNSQIILDNNLIYPETVAENIIYSDTTLKNAFDNYSSSISMSNFGKKIIKCTSLAEVARLFHINYSFAKDNTDNVNWNVVGNPTISNAKLHATNNSYVYRTFALGAYDLSCELDVTCSDPDKIIFQFFGDQAQGAGAVRYWYRLATNSAGYLYFRILTQSTGGYPGYSWGSVTTRADVYLGSCSTQKHIKITFDKTNNWWNVSFGGSWKETQTYSMPSRTWKVYLGNTADCLIDNFSLSYNSTQISSLDFDL